MCKAQPTGDFYSKDYFLPWCNSTVDLVYSMFLLLFFLFFFASQAVEYFSKPDTAPLLVSVFWEKMNHFSSEVMVGAAEDPSVPGSPLLSPLSADSF